MRTTERSTVRARWSRWWAGWRVALRMARRDVRRYRGRSALVALLVLVPVVLLVGAATYWTTSQATGPETIPRLMGSAQAVITGPSEYPIEQDAAGTFATGPQTSDGSQPPAARPVLGYDPAGPEASQTQAVARLTGGRVVPIAQADLRRVVGERRIRATALIVDARVGLGPKAELLSGRWAATASEVVVTPLGIRRGFPESGTVRISLLGRQRDVAVVGVATALSELGGQVEVVTPQVWEPRLVYGHKWLVLRDEPMPWSEVRALNAYGFTVTSAEVLRHPPVADELAPGARAAVGFQDRRLTQLTVVGVVLLFVVISLLAGPAFAVGAARQRRSLAVKASNGAEVAQLRRAVLAQALLLGAAAAVLGAAIGLGLVLSAVRLWPVWRPGSDLGAFDVPWVPVGFVVVCAVLASLVAALAPTLRIGRLDVVGLIRGQHVSPRLSRVQPGIGALLLGTGGLALVGVVAAQGATTLVLAAALGLVLGGVLLVPLALVTAGRAARRLPLTMRMAARDLARQRARSGPSVAALMAGTAGLIVFSVGLASDTEQQRQTYAPSTLVGEGVMFGDFSQGIPAELGAAVARSGPELVLVTAHRVASTEAPGTGGHSASRALVALQPGCTEAELVRSGLDPQASCHAAVAPGLGGFRSGIEVLPAAEIVRRLDLPTSATPTVERGLVTRHTALVANGSVTLLDGVLTSAPDSPEPPRLTVRGRQVLPALAVPDRGTGDGRWVADAGAYVTPETAKRLGWPTVPDVVLVHDPSGPIPAVVAERVEETAADLADVVFERGFQRDDHWVMVVLFVLAGSLTLAVTLISSALSIAEQQDDLATLAAVGATRHTRRALAAAQAAVVGLVGAALGVVVGIFPGVAITYPLTARSWDPATGMEKVVPPTIVVPWWPLVVVLVGVPLLGGLISAAAIRSAPQVTKRTT